MVLFLKTYIQDVGYWSRKASFELIAGDSLRIPTITRPPELATEWSLEMDYADQCIQTCKGSMGAVKDRRIRFGSRSIVGLMCALGKQTVLHISKLLRSDVLRASAFLRAGGFLLSLFFPTTFSGFESPFTFLVNPHALKLLHNQ